MHNRSFSKSIRVIYLLHNCQMADSPLEWAFFSSMHVWFASVQTISYSGLLLMVFGGFGITGGAHRLWSHGSYKTKWPLSILAAVGQTLALQVNFTFSHIFRKWNDVDAWPSHYHILCMILQQNIYQWCWNHRMHHKYSETDADPFNANRDFFYSHIGWIICEIGRKTT